MTRCHSFPYRPPIASAMALCLLGTGPVLRADLHAFHHLVRQALAQGRALLRRTVLELGGVLRGTVDHDGNGISQAERAFRLRRGVLLDEKQPGSVIGLNTVRARAEMCGGNVQAKTSPLGGARLPLGLRTAVKA